MSRYLNPYTDFGFKKLFGEEGSKDLLTDFLNQLLPAHRQIHHLYFKNTENLPDVSLERKAIFDIYCQNVNGEQFIVEMQKAKLHFFKDRALFYSTFPIREQAKKGDWDFRLTPVYYVAILDFKYDETEEQERLLREVALKDQEGKLFCDKLHFRFLQMPLFTKQAHELTTHFDKWLYFLKNLSSFEHIPTILNEPLFQKAFDILEAANLNPEQLDTYQKSLHSYWEVNSAIDTARKDGLEKGLAQGLEQGLEQGDRQAREAIARNLLGVLDVETIALKTGLSVDQIHSLAAEQ